MAERTKDSFKRHDNHPIVSVSRSWFEFPWREFKKSVTYSTIYKTEIDMAPRIVFFLESAQLPMDGAWSHPGASGRSLDPAADPGASGSPVDGSSSK